MLQGQLQEDFRARSCERDASEDPTDKQPELARLSEGTPCMMH